MLQGLVSWEPIFVCNSCDLVTFLKWQTTFCFRVSCDLSNDWGAYVHRHQLKKYVRNQLRYLWKSISYMFWPNVALKIVVRLMQNLVQICYVEHHLLHFIFRLFRHNRLLEVLNSTSFHLSLDYLKYGITFKNLHVQS